MSLLNLQAEIEEAELILIDPGDSRDIIYISENIIFEQIVNDTVMDLGDGRYEKGRTEINEGKIAKFDSRDKRYGRDSRGCLRMFVDV